VDLLLSGIHAADYVEAASLGFASEVLMCQTVNKKTALGQLLTEKHQVGCVSCKCQESLNIREYIDLFNTLVGDFAISSAG
jgi:hypothetical protein